VSWKNKEITHATCYLQNILVVVVDLTVSFHSRAFHFFPFSSFLSSSKSMRMLECSKGAPGMIKVCKSVREWKRAQSKTIEKLEIVSLMPFYHWCFYFLHFPSFSSNSLCMHINVYSSLFCPIFLYFYNLIQINASFPLPMTLLISIAKYKPQVVPIIMFSHHSTWNMCRMNMVLFYLHGRSTMGCYKFLPLGVTPSSVFNDAYNQKNMFPMDLYNVAQCNI